MTGDEFARLSDFTLSAESGDGARFASHFTEDAVYHDYIYGPHQAARHRAYDAELFHRDATDYRWEMFDPVFDGRQGYAWSLSSFTSTQFKGRRVVIDGMSRFPARWADRGVSRIGQWRGRDGAARRRTGADGKVFRRWTDGSGAP